MEITHDITNIAVRKQMIDEIEGSENQYRKEDSYRRFEIYRDRQEKYILEKLASDTTVQSVRDARTFTSINLTRKMIHELASIYLREPTRDFTESTDEQKETMHAHYRYSDANVKYKNANRMYKLHDQCAMKVLPKNGFLNIDVLQPHHYDVVPSMTSPEKGEVFIISSFNRNRVNNENDLRGSKDKYDNRYYGSDNVNQSIGDPDDWKQDNANKVYFWWNALYNFMTDSSGRVLDKVTKKPLTSVDFSQYTNALGEVPFVDVASDKDFEYWVRAGSGFTEFNVDFGVILSDNVNINKNQGFAIPVITSVEEPKNLKIGPDRAIWLKVDPQDETAHRPEFQFVTPSPDLQGSLQLMEDLLKYFLVSKSININDMLQGTATASSGIERLLMMVEKFTASQDDIDLFRSVEQSMYERMLGWHNIFRDTDGGLNPKVQGPAINPMSEVLVNFAGPDMVQSKTEHLDWVLKQLESGLMSSVEAIEEVREVDEDTAKDILAKISEVEEMEMPEMQALNSQIAMEAPIDERSDQGDSEVEV